MPGIRFQQIEYGFFDPGPRSRQKTRTRLEDAPNSTHFRTEIAPNSTHFRTEIAPNSTRRHSKTCEDARELNSFSHRRRAKTRVNSTQTRHEDARRRLIFASKTHRRRLIFAPKTREDARELDSNSTRRRAKTTHFRIEDASKTTHFRTEDARRRA